MNEGKSSISQAQSYKDMGEFWDTHDLTEYWEQTEPAEFEVDIQSEVTYYAVDSALSAKLADVAWQRGISVETLLNLWLQEKLQEQSSVPAA
jgi:hypothetical protein